MGRLYFDQILDKNDVRILLYQYLDETFFKNFYDYVLGSRIKPLINHDNGFLKKYPCRKPTIEEKMQYVKWRGILEAAESVQGIPFLSKTNMPDAVAAYRHFMEGSGTTRDVKFERYFRDDPSGRHTFRTICMEVRDAAYKFYMSNYNGLDASFNFTSRVKKAKNESNLDVLSNTRIYPHPVTENWTKTLGVFSFWVECRVDVSCIDKIPHFQLELSIHVEDMYNFNPYQVDIATGIKDEENGVFEITGLARQYLNVGIAKGVLKWKGRPMFASAPYPKSNLGS